MKAAPKGVQIYPRDLGFQGRARPCCVPWLQVRFAEVHVVKVYLAVVRPQAPNEIHFQGARSERPASLSHSRTRRFAPTPCVALSMLITKESYLLNHSSRKAASARGTNRRRGACRVARGTRARGSSSTPTPTDRRAPRRAARAPTTDASRARVPGPARRASRGFRRNLPRARRTRRTGEGPGGADRYLQDVVDLSWGAVNILAVGRGWCSV